MASKPVGNEIFFLLADMDIIGPFIREHFQESELPTATDQAASIEADMIQFRADMAHRIQRGWWPIIIGPRGSGKSRAIAEAVKDKYAITEVKLARHTVQELFGQEDESGKWNLGIITRYLNPNSKACVINLITPISSAVAHNFASMFDRGYFQTESNHSFTIPNQIRFVFETSNVETVSSLLLARCSLMHLPSMPRDSFVLNDLVAANNTAGITSDQLESATQALILAVDTFPKNDDVVQSKTDKMSQLRIIYSLLAAQVTGEEDEMIVFSNLLYAFCWSFGATLQDQVDVAKFDTVVRKVTKEVDVFAKVALLEKINIFNVSADSFVIFPMYYMKG